MATLPTLQSNSLSEQAFAALRGAIVMGDIAPGTHLGEVKLATDLGISRGTLREALRRLYQEGLADADDRGRHYVIDLDLPKMRDAFAVRAALEGLAAKQVTALDPDSRATALQVLAARLDDMKAAESGPVLDWIEADLNLHKALCQASGNQILLDAWLKLEGILRMSIMRAGGEKARTNMSVARHQELLDAVVEGGPDVEERVRTHVLSAIDHLLNGTL